MNPKIACQNGSRPPTRRPMLQDAKTLAGIDVSYTAVTDRSVPYLAKLPDLQAIDLSGTKADGLGIDELRLPDVDRCFALPTRRRAMKPLNRSSKSTRNAASSSGVTDRWGDLLTKCHATKPMDEWTKLLLTLA